MEVAIVLSSRCNASCSHCSTSCGPYRTDALTQDDIVRLMNETAAIDDGGPLCFHLTGGEPFLNFELLLASVTHGARLGGRVSCVTNAFWARSDEAARDRLSLLRDAGLSLLAVSVSRFHEQFVPLRKVRVALKVASDLGIATELKGAVTVSDLQPGGVLPRWKSELHADEINIFPVLPCLREGASLPDEEFYREPGLPAQVCPDEIVCVEPDGAAMSCCGQGPSSKFLLLGSVHEDSLSTIHGRFRHAGRQQILRESGPVAFARGAIAAGLGHLLRRSYAGPCDLCVHIASDPQLRRIADEMSAQADESHAQRSVAPGRPDLDPIPSERSITMSSYSLEYLQILIAKSAIDARFRDALIAAPREAAKSEARIDLTPADIELLDSLKDHLQRFGGNAQLDPEDAKNWAVGMLVTALARAQRESWSVIVASIPRRCVPDDDWNIGFTTIKRTAQKKKQKGQKGKSSGRARGSLK